MAEHRRIQRVGAMVHKALGEILLQQRSRFLGNGFVTVTAVRMTPDLGIAKIYLSFELNKDKAGWLATIEQKKTELRKLLGNRLGSKLRKIPALQFYIDDSGRQAEKVNQLLDELALLSKQDDK